MSDKQPNPMSEVVALVSELIDKKIEVAIAPLRARIEALEGRRWHERHVFESYLDELLPIRQRLAEGPALLELATQYNGVVDDMVADLGAEWSEFRLQTDAFYLDPAPRTRSGQSVTNTNVKKPVFLVQIDALLRRMQGMMPPDEASRMGFATE